MNHNQTRPKAHFFKKLLFGKPEDNRRLDHTALKNQCLNLKRVWNNEKHNDMGLEKLLRLFLIIVQFIYPGIYIRDIGGRRGLTWRNLAIEVYVLLKTILPFIFLATGLYSNIVVVIITYYLLSETIFYIATLIFVSDLFAKPRSYSRSVLLLFLNYIEIALDFSVIYGGMNLLKRSAQSVIDLAYFSFITSATIGFGDICPTTAFGKILVIFQSIIFLVFVVLFLNFFNSRVGSKNYYDVSENIKDQT